MSAIKLLEESQARLGCGCGPDLCAACREIDSRIDALVKTGGWIPVNERLPEKNTDCLVFLGWVDVGTYEPLHKTRHQGESWFSEPAGINPMFNVTHWQPLPPEAK